MKRLGAFLIIALIWLITSLFKLLSVSLCWRFGELLGSALYWILPSKRKIVQENLEVISARYPEVAVNDNLMKDIFRRSFANLTCAVKTYGMEPKELLNYVDTNLPEEFLQDIREGKGSIHCLAHIGNWEVLSKVFTIEFPKGTKFGAVFRPLDNEHVNKYVLDERERFGCKMFAKRSSIISLSNFINEGGNLGILADQRVGKKKKYARPFFGRPSARSKLPALLQRRTGAKLYMVSCHSDVPARWKITFSRVEIDSDDTEEILSAITAEYERVFLSHLLDVFWLHRYWKIKNGDYSSLSRTKSA